MSWFDDDEELGTHMDGPTAYELAEAIKRAEAQERLAAAELLPNEDNMQESCTRGNALIEGHNIVNGARLNAYGEPENAFGTIADLWSAYIKGRHCSGFTGHFTDHDVAVMLSLLKVGRLAHNPCHHDSHVDGAAYLALADDMTQLRTGAGEA